MTPTETPTRYFQHLDGGLYRLIAEAQHSDDLSKVVVYAHLWPFEPGVWVRPAAEFWQRFTPINADDVQQALQSNREAAQAAVTHAKQARRAATH